MHHCATQKSRWFSFEILVIRLSWCDLKHLTPSMGDSAPEWEHSVSQLRSHPFRSTISLRENPIGSPASRLRLLYFMRNLAIVVVVAALFASTAAVSVKRQRSWSSKLDVSR